MISIRHALHEDLVQLYQEEDKVTFVNLRLLPFRMERGWHNAYIVSEKERVSLYDLVDFIRVVEPRKHRE